MSRNFKITSLLPLILLISGCNLLGNKAESVLREAGDKAGVGIGVETVDIRLLGGAGDITGLTIRNPEGYETDYALQMQQIDLDLKISSILFKPVSLNEFVLNSPVVNLEVKGPGKINLKEIADRFADTYAKDIGKKTPRTGDAKHKSRGKKKLVKLCIRDLRIEGASFNYYSEDGKNYSGTLPSIHLTNVGGDQGVTAPRLGVIVALIIGGRILIKHITADLKEKLLDKDGFVTRLHQFIIAVKAEQPPNLEEAVQDYIKQLERIIETEAEDGLKDLETTRSKVAIAAKTLAHTIEANLNEEQIYQLEEHLATEREIVMKVVEKFLIEKVHRLLPELKQVLDETRIERRLLY